MGRIDDPDAQEEQQSREPLQAFDISSFVTVMMGFVLEVVGWTEAARAFGLVGWFQTQVTGPRAHERVISRTNQRLEEVIRAASPDQRSSAAAEAATSDADRDLTLRRAVSHTLLDAGDSTIDRMATAIGTRLGRAAIDPWDQVAAYLNDIVRVNDEDIVALRILYRRHVPLAGPGRLPHNSQNYHACHKDVLGDAAQAGYTTDDFFALCGRLSGFGLAQQVNFSGSFQTPDDLCYRLTSRGRRLGELLGFTL